jgi:23S rRNA pseudouridine1911/1915/1917 synthase
VSPSLSVLYEDNHVLAINKPAGLATIGAGRGRTTAAEAAKAYLKRKYHKPGNVYLGVMSRLDAQVSGVLLFARTSKAAARLTEQFKHGTVEKTYWALANGKLEGPAGEWRDAVLKDEAAQRMRVVAAGRAGAKQAVLRYRRLAAVGDDAVLVEIQLLTGRKHQIRVQFASRGLPILGDRKYGSSVPFPIGIALHSRRLIFEHPVKQERIELEAPLPAHWRHWVKNDNVGSSTKE